MIYLVRKKWANSSIRNDSTKNEIIEDIRRLKANKLHDENVLQACKRNYNVNERLVQKQSSIRDNNVIHQKLKHVPRWMKPLDVISLRSFKFSFIHSLMGCLLSVAMTAKYQNHRLIAGIFFHTPFPHHIRRRFACSNVRHHWQKECSQFNRAKELEIQRFLSLSLCVYESMIIMVNALSGGVFVIRSSPFVKFY